MSSGKKLAVALVWLVLLAGGAVAFKYYLYPAGFGATPDDLASEFESAWEKARNEFGDGPRVEDFVARAPLRFQAEVRTRLEQLDREEAAKFPRLEFAIDAFSGYCVFRSERFRQKLEEKTREANEPRILLHLADDKADYARRLTALQRGEVKLGVFTIDALINNSTLVHDPPARIVMLVDESRGADAIVGYKDAFPQANDVDALDRPDLRFVLTPDSPSETLARVVQTKLPSLRHRSDFLVRAKGPEDVLAQFDKAHKTEPRAYVLWEPFVSKALKEHPEARVLVDSRRFDGYIVDVLVVERHFLDQNRPVVRKVVEAYLETLAEYQKGHRLAELVREDAARTGDVLDPAEAEKLVDGIWWKNTRENYTHFGVAGQGLQPVGDMVRNITGVLRTSGAIGTDPTGGRPERLFDATVLQQLQQAGFLPDDGAGRDTGILTAEEWKSLQPIYTVPVEPIEFARGSDEVPESSPAPEQVAKVLADAPNYYLLVSGYALRQGDPAANRDLAERRAQAVAAKVRALGVSAHRVRAQGRSTGDALVTGADGDDDRPRVTFQLLQKP